MTHQADQNSNHDALNCSAARAELASLLYDDIADATRARLEAHLKTCSDCQAELANHQSTLSLLDGWDVNTDLSPLPELVLPDSQTESAPPAPLPFKQISRLARWRPILVGATAALVIFGCLALLGTNVEFQDGQMVVTVGNRELEQPTDNWPGDPKILLASLQSATRAETEGRIDTLLDSIENYLADRRSEEELRYQTLLRAVDIQRERDRQEQSALMQAMAQLIHDTDHQTQGALQEIRTQFEQQPEDTASFDVLDESEHDPALDLEGDQEIH